MDLITRLPLHNNKDAILTIVDYKCLCIAIFLLYSTTIIGSEIAQLYFNNIYRWFGLSNKIISDKDPRFIFHYPNFRWGLQNFN
jgi:hypothetical protein